MNVLQTRCGGLDVDKSSISVRICCGMQDEYRSTRGVLLRCPKICASLRNGYRIALFSAVHFSLSRTCKWIVSLRILPFVLRPGCHFSITFFPSGSNTGAERSRVKPARSGRAARRSKRRGLMRLPRSVHSPAEKWDRCFSHDAYAEDPTSTTVPG